MSGADHGFARSIAELYDVILEPFIFEPFARETAARLGGFEGEVLEVAAGTGIVTLELDLVLGPRSAASNPRGRHGPCVMSSKTTQILCSRDRGVRQSLVMATLSGSSLLSRGELRFSGWGVTVEAISRRAEEADVAIEVAGDAPVGPRSLLVSLDGQLFEFRDVFTVLASAWASYAGPAARGIGSHLL